MEVNLRQTSLGVVEIRFLNPETALLPNVNASRQCFTGTGPIAFVSRKLARSVIL